MSRTLTHTIVIHGSDFTDVYLDALEYEDTDVEMFLHLWNNNYYTETETGSVMDRDTGTETGDIDTYVDIDPEWARNVMQVYGQRTEEPPPSKRLKRTEIKDLTTEHRFSKHPFRPQDQVLVTACGNSMNGGSRANVGEGQVIKMCGTKIQVQMENGEKRMIDATNLTKKGPDKQTSCIICMDDFVSNNVLTTLPCKHSYHKKCIEKWLTQGKATCPICNLEI